MQLINNVSYYLNMIGISAILTMTVVTALLYYFVKVKKITATVENINTLHFRREDSVSYVAFKDILYEQGDLDSPGVIAVTDTLFVGGISVRGFDYASASKAERLDAQINSVAFFNVVEGPTTFRQTTRSVDLSANIAEQEEIAKAIAKEQMELDAEYQATLLASEDYVDEPEVYMTYDARLQELQKMLYAKTHMLQECEALISYMSAMSGDAQKKSGTIGEKVSQIMFSYEFNPDNFSQELTKEEIYLKAQEEINKTARSYSEALSYCHFRAKRLSARELIRLMRQHLHPLTDDADVGSFFESSYTSLFVSCDSIVEAQIERIGEEKYKEQVAEYERKLADLLKQQEMEHKRIYQRRYAQSLQQAEEMLAVQQKG